MVYYGKQLQTGKQVMGNKLNVIGGEYWIFDIKEYGYEGYKVEPDSIMEQEDGSDNCIIEDFE
jgi:hypothetical protein